jgi:hypothetical protein
VLGEALRQWVTERSSDHLTRSESVLATVGHRTLAI